MSPNPKHESEPSHLHFPKWEETHHEDLQDHEESYQSYSIPNSKPKTLTKLTRDLYYHRLLNEAPFIPVEDSKTFTLQEISWFSPKLVREGQKFVQNNFFAVICAHLGALLYGFSFKRLSSVLLRTGKSHEVSISMIRYLSTFMHFKTWYEHCMSDENEKPEENANNLKNSNQLNTFFKDVQKVRCLHRHALISSFNHPLPSEEDLEFTSDKTDVINALKNDLSHIKTYPVPNEVLTYHPQVTMSQFDMVMTQFGLVGLIYLFPKSLGVRDTTGIEGFFHCWALFGKMLGIRDEYNIALYPDLKLYHRIFLDIGVSSLRNVDNRIVTLQKSLLDGFRQFTYFGSLKSFLYYGLTSKEALPEFQGNQLYSIMSWQDKFYYYGFKFVLYIYYKFSWIHELIDFVANWVIQWHANYYLKSSSRKEGRRR